MPERKWYPGTGANPFHIVLMGLEGLKRIPMPMVVLLLLAYGGALAAALPQPDWFVAAWSVGVLFDAAVLVALPHFKRSFGPPVPGLILLAVLRWIVAGVLGSLVLPLGSNLAIGLNALAQAIGILLIYYGLWVEPQRLTLTRQRLVSPKLPQGNTLRVLHLGDIHMERWTPREEKLLAKLGELAPNVVLFSGDLLNISYTHDPLAQAEVVRLLNLLRAPLGVYAVVGSPAVDLPEIACAIYNRTPHIRWLQDEAACLPGHNLAILGINCTQNPAKDGPNLRKVTSRLIGDPFKLLLYHTPDLAPEASRAGIDLQLSGHTHGGQVRLPWYGALTAGSIYGKRFEMGRYQLGKMVLYVIRGIGMEGLGIPRIRVLCPPEITLWELRGAA